MAQWSSDLGATVQWEPGWLVRKGMGSSLARAPGQFGRASSTHALAPGMTSQAFSM